MMTSSEPHTDQGTACRRGVLHGARLEDEIDRSLNVRATCTSVTAKHNRAALGTCSGPQNDSDYRSAISLELLAVDAKMLPHTQRGQAHQRSRQPGVRVAVGAVACSGRYHAILRF